MRSSIIVSVVVATIFGLTLARHIADPVRRDEAAWLFSGVYLTHFIRGDFQNPDWFSLDAFDHPPVAKYYYGVAARLGGKAWLTLEDKARWLGQSVSDKDAAISFQGEVARLIPQRVLRVARSAAAIAALAVCLGVFVLGRLVGGPATGVAAAVSFAASRLVLYFVPIVEADFVLLAVVVWQMVFLVLWMHEAPDGKRAWVWAALSGAFLGMAVDTKLNGVLQVIPTFFAFVMSMRRGRAAIGVQEIILAVIATFAVAFALNPTLAQPVVAISGMIAHRTVQLAGASSFSALSDMPLVDRIAVGFRYAFADFGLISDSAFFPLGASLGIVGLVGVVGRAVRKGCDPDRAGLVFLVASFIWCAASFWSFSKVLWLRYLLPISPFLSILTGHGVVMILRYIVPTLAVNKFLK